MLENEMVWDLNQLVDNPEPEQIKKDLQKMLEHAQELKDKYYGKIRNFDAKELLDFIKEIEKFELEYEGTVMYCNLRYSSDSTDDISKQLHDTMRNATTKTGQMLAFTDVELGDLLKEKPEISQNPVLKEYRHFLDRKIRSVPYLLSEKEEQLIIIKDRNGIRAWSQIQGDWLSTKMFDIEIDGEIKTLSYGEIIGFYQSKNRDLRKRANKIVYSGLSKDELLWASAIRAVCSDHLQMCEWRKYPSTMTQSIIANDVKKETIDSLMKTIEKNVGIYRSYLTLKAKLMGFKKLGNWDIIAPLPESPDKEYTWKESRELVTEAYMGFDEQMGNWIDEMYQRNHIDGKPRKGKRSGAFCSTWFNGKSAYILQSFNGKIGDVYTQAHELGHAVHAYLGSRNQTPTNYEIGSCIAECGSTFGELLLTDLLLSKAQTNEERRAILTSILDEFGMAAFQVSARVWFEQSMYDALNEGIFLDGEKVSSLWTTSRDRIYGDTIEWLPEMHWEWTMKAHYYIPNYRFYNYPYVFAQLFVFALYRLYKHQGKEFIPKFKNLLAAGSSKSPWQLGKELGFDITNEDFWALGMKQAEEFIKLLENTM
jgi:oligoendopeptidase F